MSDSQSNNKGVSQRKLNALLNKFSSHNAPSKSGSAPVKLEISDDSKPASKSTSPTARIQTTATPLQENGTQYSLPENQEFANSAKIIKDWLDLLDGKEKMLIEAVFGINNAYAAPLKKAYIDLQLDLDESTSLLKSAFNALDDITILPRQITEPALRELIYDKPASHRKLISRYIVDDSPEDDDHYTPHQNVSPIAIEPKNTGLHRAWKTTSSTASYNPKGQMSLEEKMQEKAALLQNILLSDENKPVLQNWFYALEPKTKRVLERALGIGMKAQEIDAIAQALHVSVATVSNHKKKAFDALHTRATKSDTSTPVLYDTVLELSRAGLEKRDLIDLKFLKAAEAEQTKNTLPIQNIKASDKPVLSVDKPVSIQTTANNDKNDASHELKAVFENDAHNQILQLWLDNMPSKSQTVMALLMGVEDAPYTHSEICEELDVGSATIHNRKKQAFDILEAEIGEKHPLLLALRKYSRMSEEKKNQFDFTHLKINKSDDFAAPEAPAPTASERPTAKKPTTPTIPVVKPETGEEQKQPQEKSKTGASQSFKNATNSVVESFTQLLSDDKNRGIIQKWLDNLPPKHRNVLGLSMGIGIEDALTNAKISEQTRISVQTVTKYKSEALSVLLSVTGDTDGVYDTVKEFVGLRRPSDKSGADLKGLKINEGPGRQIQSTQADTGLDASSAYARDVNRAAPLLTREEEAALARKVQAGCEESAKRLAESNVRLVLKISQKYQNRGLAPLDLIQEGNIGMMTAVEKFDPETGNRFSTYATWWIRQTIERAIMNQTRDVRVPIHVLKDLSLYRRTEKELTKSFGRAATHDDIAAELGISVKDIEKTFEHDRHYASMDTPITEEGGGTMADIIADTPDNDPALKEETSDLEEKMLSIIDELKPKQKDVIIRRFGMLGQDPQTLEEVGEEMSLTRERVRQIQVEALNRLKTILSRHGLENIELDLFSSSDERYEAAPSAKVLSMG